MISRGTEFRPNNRFSRSRIEEDPEFQEAMRDEPKLAPKTQILADCSKSIISKNQSPDIGFTYSLNAYRGCEHGCVYCYARPTHEYLGYSAGLDFETKLIVKKDAAKLLRERFESKKWKPDVIVMSGVTDCYQPAERELQITRECLKVFLEFRNPVSIITKNYLVVRDLDILQDLARHQLTSVNISVTTLDTELVNLMEPRTSRPAARLKAVEKLSRAGVPVRVMAAPMILGLNSHELPQILKAASEAGAKYAGYTALRLPYAVKDIFTDWLDKKFPQKKDKILSQIRSIRGGQLNDSNFGSRMRGNGVLAENLEQVFKLFCRKYSLNLQPLELSTTQFVSLRGQGDQLQLFS